jgi:hypothetical protein
LQSIGTIAKAISQQRIDFHGLDQLLHSGGFGLQQ